MPDIRIPTYKEFKSMTGRSGIGRILKKRNDFDEINTILRGGVGNAESARALRRACIAWLAAPGASARASHGAVTTLLDRAHQRFMAFQEHRYVGTQADSGKAVPITPKPNLPFGRDITKRGGAERDVARVGNQMFAGLTEETKTRHWGPNVARQMNQMYTVYKTGGGSLSIGAWADHIYTPNLEDDPNAQHFFGNAMAAALPQGAKVRDGVKYCTPAERKAYALSFQGGYLVDRNGDAYDTTARETHFSKYGWAIFVLGFDNVLYSNTHVVDLFHHSSFFAGDPVQCGGEICCIGGKVRYITNKTGHYRSSTTEFYRLLSFLSYNGIDLSNVLSCNDVAAGKFYRASDMFGAHGKNPPGAAVLDRAPTQLHQPGVPQWPSPPMRP